jgi:hypothetical protein
VLTLQIEMKKNYYNQFKFTIRGVLFEEWYVLFLSYNLNSTYTFDANELIIIFANI